ncbi:hypothetical protein GGS24DRAFT_495858 [Hypoxylon argillaceum]|nr:hypothetical protein GGS24DRAFT_495858 [Hypoxylon argillaceum]
MEGARAPSTTTPGSDLPEGSPAATAREASQTPGRDTMQLQPAAAAPAADSETVPNGVKVNGVDSKGTSSPSTATPVLELARPASGTPLQPLPAQLSSVQPTIAQPSTTPPSTTPPASTLPASTLLPSTQPSSMHLPSEQPPSAQLSPVHLPLTQPQAIPQVLHGQPGPLQAPQPSPQVALGPISSIAAPSSHAPPSSPAAQPNRQHRETNRVPKRIPSPELDHDVRIPRFNRDLSLLADSVQQSCPEAVRRVIRDKWEKCIMGSEFHHAFLLNAIIHHASGTIMRRAVRDFGQNMVWESKHEIAAHLRPQDIDEIAAVILEKCSDQFLDQVLEKRLNTIDARSLINALARAERLGYENSDILDDQQAKAAPTAQIQSPTFAHVNQITSTPSQPPAAALTRGPLPYQTQPIQRVSPTTDLQCRLCWRKFQNTKPYEYHVQKQICMKVKSDAQKYQHWCEECGAGFTTKVGQQYHTTNAVCGLHATAAATPKSQATTPIAEAHPPVYPVYSNPPTQLPVPSSQPYSTPVRPHLDPMETPSSSQDDPYRHLTLQRRAELDEELRQAEMSYAPRFKEAEAIVDPVARKAKMESLQNTFSTKQSMVRKKYGVRLRVRRTRAVIDEERSRLGLKHSLSSPGPTPEMPSVKRQRTDDANLNTVPPYHIGREPAVHIPVPPPANLLSVSEMNNSGLGGSTATAAMADPTASMTSSQLPFTEQQAPPNSLSSLQRKGYRVSSHVGQATQPAPAIPVQRNGSASAPVVLDESSDDTDTDEDIPATVPPKKVL